MRKPRGPRQLGAPGRGAHSASGCHSQVHGRGSDFTTIRTSSALKIRGLDFH